MTTTLFLSENKLKNFSDLNNALDPDLLKNAVREAQDINIQRMLGNKLYLEMIDKVNNSQVTGNYLTLMNYIQDALLYWAYYEALESIWLRPRNNGLLMPQGGAEATAADTAIYDKKRESVKNKAEWYSERLVGYLIDNQTLFPSFGTETGMEIWPDQSNQFKSPFVTRNRYAAEMEKMGIKVIDGRYKHLPQ